MDNAEILFQKYVRPQNVQALHVTVYFEHILIGLCVLE